MKGELLEKRWEKTGWSAYLYYPDMPNRSVEKVCSITVLRTDESKESAEALLQAGLEELAEEKHLVLCFPNPPAGGWRWKDKEGRKEDICMVAAMQDGMNRPDDGPVPVNEKGIPTYEFMLSTWHTMNDTRYFIGIGDGASLLAAMIALDPRNMAAALLLGAQIDEETEKMAVGSPVPAWLCGCSDQVVGCLKEMDGVSKLAEEEGVLINDVNPAVHLVIEKEKRALGPELLSQVWEELFSKTRRLNTSFYGDCSDRTDMEDPGFEWFLEDKRLDGKPHSWLVHTPQKVREGKVDKVPVVFFYHGGSDNPSEAAEMSRFHEIGEEAGFITVYPWGSNRAGWNMELLPDGEDDLSYCKALIIYMLEHYPIDEQRVYLSGFSNGAGMAQTIAMIYPELVAALGHIDSNWPGVRGGYCEVNYRDVEPMRLALEKKETYDWRMPVWYTYGTREASSPIRRNSSQQHQYDFWKRYNKIEVEPTPEAGEEGPEHGVDGKVSELLHPDLRHPEHYYTVQRFFSEDTKRENTYNFVLMHDKGHEVAPMDARLAWNYMKQFCRRKNGTVGKTGEE